MKRTIVFTLIALFITAISYGKEGYSFYQQDGKWGVLFNGEPCLLPCYDEVSDIDGGGRFFYKENGKWGIANIWKKITDPFCDSLACFKNLNENFVTNTPLQEKYNITIYRFSLNGKWGLCTVDGIELLSPKYDNINNRSLNYKDIGISFKEVFKKSTRTWLYWTRYFLVQDDNTAKLVDILGTEILPDVISYDYFFSKKGHKKFEKTARKFELSRKKSKSSEMLKEKLMSIVEKTNSSILFRNYVRDEYASYEVSEQKMKSPRKIWFGTQEEIEGDTLIVYGLKSIVNDYGFISTPLVYDSPYFRLQRNPTDVYAYSKLLEQQRIRYLYYGSNERHYVHEKNIADGSVEENMNLLRNKIQAYSELLDMANNLNDKEAHKTLSKLQDDAKKRLSYYEDGLRRTTKIMNFNAKVDRIANASTSFLYSMANAMGGNSSTAPSTYSSNDRSSSSGASSNNNSSTMTMSDQMNYNTMRNTYNKWASDLMQMKNMNGNYRNGFNANDKKHAQSEMKRLRNEAMKKWGKEIPYNSIEDWR